MHVALPAPWPQSGAIPYRWAGHGLEVLLITSRNRSHWIIPKGMVALGLGAAASASREAREEAGVHGRISAEAIGSYHARKWGLYWTVVVYPMAVDMLLDRWPEQSMRRRCWFPVQLAAQQVSNAELRALLTVFPELVC